MNSSTCNREKTLRPPCAIPSSTSLLSVSSSYSTLSGCSSSSSYYRGSYDASLSSLSSLGSIEDLQAIPAYEDWNYGSLCLEAQQCTPLLERRRRRRPLRERLNAIWNEIRTYATALRQEVSLYNVIVGLVFCYYAWALLRALLGHGANDDSRCTALLLSQLVRDGSPGSGDLA